MNAASTLFSEVLSSESPRSASIMPRSPVLDLQRLTWVLQENERVLIIQPGTHSYLFLIPAGSVLSAAGFQMNLILLRRHLSYKERREITAATLGLTVKEYEDLRDRKIVERCKVLL